MKDDLMKPQINQDVDPAAWARSSAAAGAKPVYFDHPTINYTITPQKFVLEIPVEALVNLSEDSHTRILAMLNAWIAQYKSRTEKP